MDHLPTGPVMSVAIFPRRPKLLYGGDNDLVAKFNSELFRYALHAGRENVPVLAALPIASTLQELATTPVVAWFRIGGAIIDDQFIQISRNAATFQILQSENEYVSEVMNLDSVVELISDGSVRQRSWKATIDVLDLVRRATYFREFGISMFRPLHRPYVILCS
jgi:hypothetical protein